MTIDLHPWRALKAKAEAATRRRGRLLDLLTHPALRGPRWPLYALFPAIRLAVAHYICRNGHVTRARRELGTARPAGAHRMAARLDAMLAVIADGHPAAPPSRVPGRPAANGSENGPVLMALSSSLPFHQAGYARRSDALLRALRTLGVTAHAATRPNFPADRPAYRLGLVTPAYRLGLVAGDGTAEPGGVVYQHLSAPGVAINRSPDDAYIAAYAEALAKLAEESGAAVLHAHSNFINGLAAAQAGRRLGLPVVYEVRGLWFLTQAAEDPEFAGSELARYQQAMEMAALGACDAVVAIAACLRDELVRLGVPPGKIHVMPNAVDPALFEPAPRDAALARELGMEGRTVVGFAGSLNGYEGVDRLIDAVTALAADGLDLGLVVAGGGPAAAALRRRARRSGGRIVFTGPVAFARMRALYSVFDICPLPRRDLPVCRAVPPMKALEIMAMAKPLIVSALPPLLEFGEEGVSRLSCPPDDTAALAAALRRLALDAAERERLGRAARAWVVDHRAWDGIAKRYRNLYQSL
ncbi:glycosyltransferase [Azospirillum sp.]|uniref:glycosyltransferase n=1 Tax=Azospirillum sp. TaxID=34012 RepID=UPI002D693AD9|nr:glycosyltransferase [Azospirillum sp.]HYD64553.1 glycosyltransferase [Azospirillum sp.]